MARCLMPAYCASRVRCMGWLQLKPIGFRIAVTMWATRDAESAIRKLLVLRQIVGDLVPERFRAYENVL
jgi:hypothetical protein